MKKIILGTLGIFIGSILLVSCSSQSDVLSSFSKRKYLKNFKESKKTYEVIVEEPTAQLENTKAQKVVIENNTEIKLVEENNILLTPQVIETAIATTPKKVVKQIEKEYRNWDNFNRNYSTELLASSKEYNNLTTTKSRAEVDTIVLAILAILLPPLAVYLFDDAISTNFWVDLLLTFLFWIPGIIFAFLVIFGGVSL